MILVAVTLGLLGSLHCLGMCGPLAMGVMQFGPQKGKAQIGFALLYNMGRVLAYVTLGALVGGAGTVFFQSGIQGFLTLAFGVLLVFLFLYSVSLENWLLRSEIFSSMYRRIQNMISDKLKNGAAYPPVFGFFNGLLPCGLVYVALTGAFAQGNIWEASLFMLGFGAGTFPSLALLMMGGALLRFRRLSAYKYVLPYVQLAMGLLLIYRAIAVDLPLEFDLNLELSDPVMCHE